MGRRVFRNQHHHLDVRAPKIAGASQNAASAIGAAGIGDAASQNMSSQILGSSLDLCLPSSGREKHEGATKFLPCRARGMPIEHDFKVRPVLTCTHCQVRLLWLSNQILF